MQANGLDERSLRDGRYDGILHLVTAACGAEEHYSLENNEVRSESVEVARDVSPRDLLCRVRLLSCCVDRIYSDLKSTSSAVLLRLPAGSFARDEGGEHRA